MNQIENQENELEITSQTNDAEVSNETQDKVSNDSELVTLDSVLQEKTESDEKQTSEVVAEENVDDDDNTDDGLIEWTQKRSSGSIGNLKPEDGEKAINENGDAIIADLQKQLLEKDNIIAERDKLIDSFSMSADDPIIKTWNAHKERHGSDASPSLFMQELGQIKFVDQRSDEEKLGMYFKDLAVSAGVREDEIESAIQEDLDAFYSKTLREKQVIIRDAEKHLSNFELTSVEGLEKSYKEQVNKIVEENTMWIRENYNMAQDFVNKVVSKGRYNGKPIDSKWGDKIMEAFRESRAVLDPRYMVLADPDKDGNQFMFIPETVEMIDAIEFRKENLEFYKKQIRSGRSENLNERAEKAENARIKKELVTENGSTKFDREWLDANKSFGIKIPA
jgi:hypothetical protein